MADTKTRPTGASVDDYLAARASPRQLADVRALIQLGEKLTGQPAVMWGPSIIGHGKYRYTYASGHSGETCLVAFAVRGKDLVTYLSCDDPAQAVLLAKLGKHKMGKSCLYFKRLADLDVTVLEQLIAGSVADTRRRYPASA